MEETDKKTRCFGTSAEGPWRIGKGHEEVTLKKAAEHNEGQELKFQSGSSHGLFT